ncbi:MAG: hypothetical protein M3R36_19645 [Bacteroidota bacterium]|nr:hypothetical protein [Bacteroidota bacterium]
MKYGCITGSHKSKEYPVAASQLFNRSAGGAFVIMNASGHIQLALSATATIFGFAIVPLGLAQVPGSSTSAIWQSSATAGADRLPVITNKDALFLLKASVAPTQSQLGDAVDLIGVNDGTVQQINPAAGATDVVIINALGSDTQYGGVSTDVVVKMNPAKLQAD